MFKIERMINISNNIQGVSKFVVKSFRYQYQINMYHYALLSVALAAVLMILLVVEYSRPHIVLNPQYCTLEHTGQNVPTAVEGITQTTQTQPFEVTLKNDRHSCSYCTKH